jgi:hypothetical protein
MKYFASLLTLLLFAALPAAETASAGSFPNSPGNNQSNSGAQLRDLSRTFYQTSGAHSNARGGAAAFSLSFARFTELYAYGGLITVYEKTTDETYEDGYVYDMDVGDTDTSAPTVYLFPEIDYDGSYTLRITDPTASRFGADYPQATHALVEEYEPGDYEEGYYYVEYYTLNASGIYQVGTVEVEGDGSMWSFNEPVGEETIRASFPLDDTMTLDKITVGYDDDFEQDIQTRQIVEMHGYGLLDLGKDFGDEVVEIGAFINDMNYQEPGETDPNEVIDFETLYTMVGADGTVLTFYVAIPDCDNDDGCEVAYKGEIEITDIELWRLTPADAVANERGQALPEGLTLSAPYPNPASGSATLTYTLDEAAEATLSVYDALGRRVATLASGMQAPGEHMAEFDGSALPSGVYLARLSAGPQQATQRIVLHR